MSCAGISVAGVKAPLTSRWGKLLLKELATPKADLDTVMRYITDDANAGRLKDAATGNTAYHLLVSGDHPVEFVMPVLELLLQRTPEGVKAVNLDGSCPLHISLAQYDCELGVVFTLLRAYPAAAGVANKQGFTPLFYCVMRDNPSPELVRAVCKACPQGPATKNLTHSLPLHFACKRERPNREVLHMLLKRHPDAAKEKNDFGLLPLHVVSVSTDDVVAVEMVYNAYPEAIKVPDRQGRTCLHLAVLAVGKDHEAAVSREEGHWCNDYVPGTADANAAGGGAGGGGGGAARGHGNTNAGGGKAAAAAAASSSSSAAKGKGDDDDQGSDDDDELEEAAGAVSNELVERDGSRSRRVMQFLIDKWPLALVTDNNFQATPVQTVLEKTKRIKVKSRKVMVFGLFDDPPSSRLLLTSHRFRAERRLLPPLRASHWEALRELNWLARRDAMLVSLYGEKRPFKKGSTTGLLPPNPAAAATTAAAASTATPAGSKAKPTRGKGGGKGGGGGGAKHMDLGDLSREIVAVSDADIPPHNLLARLRRRGHVDVLRLCISWV